MNNNPKNLYKNSIYHIISRNQSSKPLGMCVRLIPVDDSASWLALESCKTSPKAVIVTGPFIPLVLTAAVIVCAILKTLTPAGKLQFSKSHHTETLTFRDSSSWRLAEKLEWDEYCDDED